MALAELQGRVRTLIQEMETISAKPECKSEDVERLKAINAEIRDLKSGIEALREAEETSNWAKKSAGMLPLSGQSAKPGEVTVEGFLKSGVTEIENKGDRLSLAQDGEGVFMPEREALIADPAYKAAFRQYVRKLGRMNLKMEELKTLQEGLDVSGGYLVAPEMLNRIIAKEPTPTVAAGRVTRLTTSRDALEIPKSTYTTDNKYTTPMRVTWTGEIPASSTAHRVTDPTWGKVRIPIYSVMLSMPITHDLVDDASFPILNWCSGKFSETIDLLYEEMILTGTGAGQPQGITTSSSVSTVASGGASTLTADGVVDLAYALPPQYDRNAVFVMNKLNTAKALAKLKDGDGRYLWASDTNNGLQIPAIRRDLLGYPVLYTEFMPDVAASAKPIIFGDLSGYYLVTRAAFSIRVLEELYAETNQILLLGHLRFGGLPVEDFRMKLQNVAAS